MAFLNDRAIGYKEKLIRANALDKGDVFVFEGKQAVVLSVVKSPFKPESKDAAQKRILELLEDAGAHDEISKFFDEATTVTGVTAEFDEDGEVTFTEFRAHFAEWEVVVTYV